jgi:hypothetical protein
MRDPKNIIDFQNRIKIVKTTTEFLTAILSTSQAYNGKDMLKMQEISTYNVQYS